VIPNSHLNGISRPENMDWTKETEVSCNVKEGGIMINNKQRRVIHLEFSNQELPAGLQWAERLHLQ
jgi:hypothetical protein